MADHLVCISLDFDSVSLWMALGQTSPTPLSRGEFGAVAAVRLLDLFHRHGIDTTWFVPGLTIDTFETTCRQIVDGGHEIGHHGYDHVSPVDLSREAELDQLKRGNEAIERISGQRARGYRSPAWDLSKNTIALLQDEGFRYDSSMMGHDYLPYRARVNDIVEPGRPPNFGTESGIWELPVAWSADDFPHFEYFRGNGLRPASGVLENWLDDYRYLRDHFERGVMTYTLHPFVIGRGHRMMMLDRLLGTLRDEGAQFVTAERAIEAFAD
jgi:peptidoglycan/xylan/chitin deacetylase (PgdA/CDA1 family)